MARLFGFEKYLWDTFMIFFSNFDCKTLFEIEALVGIQIEKKHVDDFKEES